jgi:two-component system, NtrC family, sensor histidine kinase PilS
MLSLDENEGTANSPPLKAVQMLIVGRLIAIFLLLITSWVWYTGRLDFSFEELPRGPLSVFVIAVGMTGAYFLLLRLSKRRGWQVRAQLLVDAFLITWLVWQTGDLSSPYITLYIVLIGVSSIFLRPLSTIAMALVCAALFLLLASLTAFAVIESSGEPQAMGKVVQIVSFHLVAFLVVGLLAARLADKRSSGERLKEATRSLADLRALHERIVESIRSGLITTDLEGKIFTANAAAAEITGLPIEQMEGRSVFDVIGEIEDAVELAMNSKSSVEAGSRFELDLTTPEGFAIHIGYSVSPLVSEKGQPTGMIVSFQDLTEIRSMEESIRRKDRLAAVGRVGAGLAHEIRNPLGAMRGAIQVLEATTPKDSVHSDLMGIILRESDRLNSIITNFLSYARPTAGNFTQTDVCEAIRETVKLIKHSPDVNEEHVFETRLPDEPVEITADVTQIKQIFWNLARNAVNAMPDGGKLVFGVESLPSKRVRITFEDTGIGMSPERFEQLFEPFSNSTTGGTGLGLSIVYQIVREHGGTINVRSAEGEGTLITVELPVENYPAVATRKEDDGLALKRFVTLKEAGGEDTP